MFRIGFENLGSKIEIYSEIAGSLLILVISEFQNRSKQSISYK